MQSSAGAARWIPEGGWSTGEHLRVPGLGADAHLRRASSRLESADPPQWRATAARAFADRLADLVAAVHRLTGDVAEAEQRVAELEAELASAQAALNVCSPWWAAR